MVRIAGITLPNKKVEIALTYIFGIGLTRSKAIVAKCGVDPNTRTNDLTETDANKLREEIEKNYRIEGELRREVQSNIKRLKEIGSYRGSRHIKGLPLRGQRTKTNSRTTRGNTRRTMASGRAKLSKT